MKVMTILGTRPEIIRLSLVVKKLDRWSKQHILVHTGQNYDRLLNKIFFEQLGVRTPDYQLSLNSYRFGDQVGTMFTDLETILDKERPDRVLVLGDTNSALCAVVAERMGYPVYHMEAGNRCHDHSVPEEINRKIIDSVSSYNLPYTPMSRENLLREGIPNERIWVSGNPIFEVLQHYKSLIDKSYILEKMGLQEKNYILVTAHRAENVDNQERLGSILKGLQLTAKQENCPIICSVHPRTKQRLKDYGLEMDHPQIKFCEPFGFFDFVRLQKSAKCVITDSGTVQEESCIFGVPAVTIRRSTERPETVLCGSNTVSGLDGQRIAECVKLMIESKHDWPLPEGYSDPHVSSKIANMILGGLFHV